MSHAYPVPLGTVFAAPERATREQGFYLLVRTDARRGASWMSLTDGEVILMVFLSDPRVWNGELILP